MLDRAIFFSRLAMAESGFWARGGRLGAALALLVFFFAAFLRPTSGRQLPPATGCCVLLFFVTSQFEKTKQLKVERGFPGWLMGQNFWFLY